MKKAVITAYDVNMARKAGQARIIVPEGSLITPQAADDARDYGIALARGGEAPMPSRSSSASILAMPAPSTTNIKEEVRRQVLARLDNAAPASLDAIISSVMADGSALPEGGATPFIRKAGTVSLVASSALPGRRKTNSDIAAVNMIDALPPNITHPGIAYMSWENVSFAWTFKHDEVLVVLEGEISFSVDGTTLVGKPGDALLIPAGSSVTLSTKGEARCVLSSWSNPATAKG